LIIHSLTLYQRADRRAQVIWPDDDGQDTLPERQMQEADGKQPAGKPGERSQAMVMNFCLFHTRYINLDRRPWRQKSRLGNNDRD